MKIDLPQLSLVVLMGASGSGKSSFAHRHFKSTEVLSSDAFRALVADDENDQSASADAFDALHHVAGIRLAAGRLTVVDATNVRAEDRRPLVELARRHHVLPCAIVLNLPDAVCQERNQGRANRDFGPHVVRRHTRELRRGLRGLRKEGFRYVAILNTPAEVEAAEIVRTPLWNDRRDERGPFDIVGDVHGCLPELDELLDRLGYTPADEEGNRAHPQGRKVVFLGDLVDRGPDVPGVLRRAMAMVESGSALAVPGNHDVKLVRKLRGKDVRIAHGLAETLAQLEGEPEEFRSRATSFLDGLVSHYLLDGGDLVVAHAGLKQELQGRGSGSVRTFALYGETTGETDEFGLPVRFNWAAEYRGPATVVYGHTPVPEPEWLNRTINIDTGCVFGGRLTALRWPERELVSVPARETYAEPVRPLAAAAPGARSAQQEHDDVLDVGDVTGKRLIQTALRPGITIRHENAAAALEVMSRFGVDPRWILYLPPTMSPVATSSEPGLLEHPADAFAYFRREGVERVVCEEKHMGSRAVVVACRSAEAARERFGVETGESGRVYTRTGRPFFDDAALEEAFLGRVREAATAAGLWDELETTWLCLDCELMPWSAKAQGLLRQQYAAVAAAGRASLPPAVRALEAAAARGVAIDGLGEAFGERLARVERYAAAYRPYCWPVTSLDDLKLAPFHVLASEGAVHHDRDHAWHMALATRLCEAATGVLTPTRHVTVDLDDEASLAAGTAFWYELTGAGGEGMVVKPSDFVARGASGVIQPAVKCRGPEYLRIIYGPEYDAPGNLERLRSRSLGAKRGLALREFALGLEGLERFVRREPLRHVHECAFAVLALESEPVDPRL